ncbi:ABC transporter permease [Kitasatospora sp. NPDC057223]|uniref:ABC transporter permease n=1 Tax=Kitasatospora sp. NPDC057223 TaxID=3346055 RepID=UPI00362C36D4
MTAPVTSARRWAPTPAPRARFGDLLAAEWLKLRSLRSMRWAFPLSALALVLLNANAAVADYQNWPRYDEGIRANFVPGWAYRDAFTNNSGISLMLIAGSLGAITLVGEYSTGLVRTSFAAVPARRALLSAKAAVLTAVMLVYGAVISVVSFLLSQAILSGRDIGLSLGHPGAWRGVVASALLAPVCALVGLGLGALVRHSATTVVTVVTVLLLVPNFLTPDRYWSAVVYHLFPFRAWQRLGQLDSLDGGFHERYPSTPGGAWLVFLLWPLVSVLVTLVVVDRRDV